MSERRTTQSANIRFNDGDETQFDTHNVPELFCLFHQFLIENGLKLKSVESIELIEADYISGDTVATVEKL